MLPACAKGGEAPAAPSRQSAIEKVRLLTAAGSFQSARTLVDGLLREYPDDPLVHMAAAALFQKMGLATKAIAEYNMSRQLSPQLIEPLLALSELHLESLDLDLGLYFARLAVEKKPNSEPAHLALATALLASDKLTDAKQEISQLLRNTPNNPRILILAYHLNRKRGDLSSASFFLKWAIKKSPPKPQWLYNLSELLEMLGDYNGALRSLNELLAIDQDSVEAHAKLANVLEFSCRDYNAAIKQYRKLRELDPESLTAQAGIDRCQAKKNDLAFELKLLVHKLFGAIFSRFLHTENPAFPTDVPLNL